LHKENEILNLKIQKKSLYCGMVRYLKVYMKTLFNAFKVLCVAIMFNSCYSSDPFGMEKEAETKDSVVRVKSKYLYGFNLDSVKANFDTIQKNQTLSEILGKYNIGSVEIADLMQKSKGIYNLRNIRPNHAYQVFQSKDTSQKALCFIYHPSKLEYVRVNFSDSISVQLIQNKVDTVKNVITASIEGSLYQTIVNKGASPALSNLLYDVYAWQIDFFDIQKGDKFAVYYDQLEINGEVIGVNKIYASEFIHLGQKYDAYLFEKEGFKQYYNSKGESLKRNFLKAPLEYKRISSTFSYRRLHPVHNVYKPHLGVDYAAPTGTPVVALGDAKVTKMGYNGGAGHMIKLKHSNNYETAYLHLSRYAKGLKVGKMVKQGQVIGYVGSTGWSTGPHLDFRVWKNGKNIDPLKIKPSNDHTLSNAEKQGFLVMVEELSKKFQ
jgi:murein DD-endopeptidase MepM/ murein hydrolase activator NlpD